MPMSASDTDRPWRHTNTRGNEGADAAAFIPGNATLLMYHPASETGEAWLHTDDPVDVRGWA